MSGEGKNSAPFNAWNPGLESQIPGALQPLITLFRSENSYIDYAEAKELADICGLKPTQLSALRPERLVAHELLIRVTADLSVPDDAVYEVLGINLRSMVATIFEFYVLPNMSVVQEEYDRIQQTSTSRIAQLLEAAAIPTNTLNSDRSEQPTSSEDAPLLKRLFGFQWFGKKPMVAEKSAYLDPMAEGIEFLERLKALAKHDDDPLEQACHDAAVRVVDAILAHRGRLATDNSSLIKIARNLVCNRYGSSCIGHLLEPYVQQAVNERNYRVLPAQEKPVIMNVKGASASGKSTIRPQQRQLAGKLGIPWEDFALISPDYWRKYLLTYESLGEHAKYGAMLTGHELEIVDKKLDRYMAEKAAKGKVSHLLIDRFRFDSFSLVEGRTADSRLLSRFGDRIFLFFMVTSPSETVERAWKRGISTGRFKAVDDLLYHNVEAYTGMPALFFSWIQASDKRVHVEFLDNDVPLGDLPKTGAFVRDGVLTVLDVNLLLNIDRFRKVNVSATSSERVFQGVDVGALANTDFIQRCFSSIHKIRLADRTTSKLYALLIDGRLVWWDHGYLSSEACNAQVPSLLALVGYDWKACVEPLSDNEADRVVSEDKSYTFGY